MKTASKEIQQLNDAQRQTVENSMNLVPLVVWRHFASFAYDEEISSIGYLALCNAALTWDESKGTFSTYACVLIRNAIRNELKKRNRAPQSISLETEIYEDMPLEEILEGGDEIEITDISTEKFLKSLSDLERKILDLRCRGYRIKEIEKITELTFNEIKYLRRKIKKKYLEYQKSR